MSSTRAEPALAERATVVVADGLAGRQWELHLSAAEVAAGSRAWIRPSIETYGNWLERLWQSSAEQRALPLGPAQAFALWRQIVADSPEGAHLLGDRGAARWAAEAFELCCDWNVDLDRERAGATQGDFRAFLGWRRRYLDTLGDNGWIDRAQIAGFLATGDRLSPQRLILADLDERTPQQRALFARLERDGWRVERWSTPETSAVRLRVEDMPQV